MYTIGRTFKFEAKHYLPTLPDDHPLAVEHWHSYEITVNLEGPLDSHGWVYDYNDFADFDNHLTTYFDYQLVNNQFYNPTAERLAQFLYGTVKSLTQLPEGVSIQSVTVREEPGTFATWTPE